MSHRLPLLTALAVALLAPSALAAPGGTTPETGNVLVLLARDRAGAAATATVTRAITALFGGAPAGKSVPDIGLITLRPPAGVSPAEFAAAVRHEPGVTSVQLERRYVPRAVPNDPALTAPNDPALTAPDSYTGVVQWTLAREGFYSAWNITHGKGALVGVIDTGIAGGHPDLRTKIAAAVDQQTLSNWTGPARTDQVGHGTHVASLACAATNNGIGMAGAGYDCRLVIEKTDFTDSSIAASIVDAANRHVQALNMSFGPESSNPPPPPKSEVRALDYAAAHKVVLVAAAADTPTTNQGDPADVLQPAGTGPDINRGLGLDVTAADYSSDRASFAGRGKEISLAAYGADNPSSMAGPPGIFGAFPANETELEEGPEPCLCRTTFDGSNRYAYLEGTSMAAPQVAATAALMRNLNPFASVKDIVRILKRTATRAAGTGWGPNLGWGILNAGAALAATRVLDRLPPTAKLTAPAVTHHRTFTISWTGHDRHHRGLVASGLARFLVSVKVLGGSWRRLASTAGHRLRFHGRAGTTYEFRVVAVDRAGNRQRHPATARVRVL